MSDFRQQLIRSCAAEGIAPSLVRDFTGKQIVAETDLELARAAAAEAVSKSLGDSWAHVIADGDNDSDDSVQAALVAIRMMRERGAA